ncbi:hypothetical protein [Streptosporangium sandarakinum]|uniref:hypothetical protein n=1 Tax=Streptosporangium sandarakinum TaxID=1260955 RepID=UPI00342172B0
MVTTLPMMRVPRPAAWWIILVIMLVGAAVGGTLRWLLSDPALTAPGPGSPGSAGAGTAREEIVRTALAAGAGVGAAVTLMPGSGGSGSRRSPPHTPRTTPPSGG